MAAILLAWSASSAGATRLLASDLVVGPGRWLVAAIPAAAAIYALFAFVRFLREADELQRAIQIEALAIGFGGSFLTFVSYRVFEPLGAPPADLSYVPLVLAVFYTVGIFRGWRRYR